MAKIASLSGELASLGLPPDAMEFLPLAANQTRELAQKVAAMAQAAGEE
jgi:hypothetical protein